MHVAVYINGFNKNIINENEIENKNAWQGNLCEKIAYLYSHSKTSFNLLKSASYHNLANNYYLLANKVELAQQATLLMAKENLENLDDLKRDNVTDTFNVNSTKMVALDIKKTLDCESCGLSQTSKIKYLLYWSSGKLCTKYGLYDRAIRYFTAALVFAIRIKESKEVELSLQELYQCFAKQTNDDSTLKRIRPYLAILNSFRGFSSKASAFIVYAKVLIAHGNTDSALSLLNQIQFDERARLYNSYDPYAAYEALRQIYQIKQNIFTEKQERKQ